MPNTPYRIPLDALADVNLTGAFADNEVLAYAATTGDWLNQTASEAGVSVEITWGDGLTCSSPTASVDFNSTNLKITSNELDTIQSIATGATPTFANLLLSGANIGIAADSDLIYLTSGALTVNGTLSTTGDLTVGNATSDVFNAAGHLEHQGARFQNFGVGVKNDSGTLKHRIVAAGLTGGAAIYDSKITGPSTVWNATPSVDGSTDFVAGAGLEGDDIILDTAAQSGIGYIRIMALLNFNKTTELITPDAFLRTIDVAGYTIQRLGIRFRNSSGAIWDVDTTNIASGEEIQVQIFGFID